LNGAALPRTADDIPDKIILPQGFQVLEEILFGDWNEGSYSRAKVEITGIKNIIAQFKQEPNRAFKFKNELIFDALRAAMIRVTTLGISGFDSPVAENSIPEAAATLESIQSILNVYATENNPRSSLAAKQTEILSDAIDYLNSHGNFNSFDRAYFITHYINPVYSTIVKTAHDRGYLLPKERRPLNQQAESIFSDSLFDVSFYSPTERYRSTPERVELGKLLFFDPILSATRNRSCGTCHKPELAFTDGLKTALAVDQKTFLLRNTPTLWNSVFQTRQFHDSRTAMLEHQLSDVVHNQEEMKGSLSRSVKELGANARYAAYFRKAYASEADPLTEYNIANAISSYVRSLIAVDSRFDQYMRGDYTKMSSEEKKGFNLFMGKAKCATCHFIPLFNGLVPPEFSETESEILGVPQSKDVNAPLLDKDEGKFRFSHSPLHKFAFKTPTLRNIELTAPYMHNGVYNTLEEVMDFYNKGGW
jgi:cytochrome c peroxidase